MQYTMEAEADWVGTLDPLKYEAVQGKHGEDDEVGIQGSESSRYVSPASSSGETSGWPAYIHVHDNIRLYAPFIHIYALQQSILVIGICGLLFSYMIMVNLLFLGLLIIRKYRCRICVDLDYRDTCSRRERSPR